MIQSEQMQDRGMEIIEVHSIHCRFEADLIGFPVTDATANAAPGQPRCEAVGVVIPAWLVTRLCNR